MHDNTSLKDIKRPRVFSQGTPGTGENPAGIFLPCLNSNISIENHSKTTSKPLKNKASESLQKTAKADKEKPKEILSTQHKKTAFILQESIQNLSNQFGVNYLGFLTLTFADHITDPKEAQKRLNSLLSNVIKKRYREYVGVYERQKSGRIHYHLLVVLDEDIKTGVSFKELEDNNYKSASPALRKEWSFWRMNAKKYRFGRTELLPVKSTIEAMSKYVGKYISKSIEARNSSDKGQRLVRYSKGARAGTTRFQFVSDGSAEWRRKTALFAAFLNFKDPDLELKTLSDMSEHMGKRWAHTHRAMINDIDDIVDKYIERHPIQ